MKKESQKERVLKYLVSHKKGISAIDGFTKFARPITQMHTIICKLREDGHKIETVMMKNKNTGTYYSMWKLSDE